MLTWKLHAGEENDSDWTWSRSEWFLNNFEAKFWTVWQILNISVNLKLFQLQKTILNSDFHNHHLKREQELST